MKQWLSIFSAVLLAGAAVAADLRLRDGRVLRGAVIVAVETELVIVRHEEAIEGVPRGLVPGAAVSEWQAAQEAAERRRAEYLAAAKAAAAAARVAELARLDAARMKLRRIDGVVRERRGALLRVECVAVAPTRAGAWTDALTRRGASMESRATRQRREAQERAAAEKQRREDPLLEVAPIYGEFIVRGVPGAEKLRVGERVRVAAERGEDSTEFGWQLPAYSVRPVP